MEINITKPNLVTALARTAGIADRKSSMQILSNVLIDAGGPKTVRVSATDLNLSATGLYSANVREGGTITVPAKTLYDIVKSMPSGMISLRTEGDVVFIEGGRSHFQLHSLPSDEYPSIPSASGVEFFDLDAAMLLRMIEQTAFSISNDETRPHLNGALFQGDGKNLRMVSTDGHRLSKVEFKIGEAGFYNFSMVVPFKAITEIRRLVDDGEGIVSVAVHKQSVYLRRDVEIEKEQEGAPAVTAEVLLVSKLIDSEFPPYDQVIPASNERFFVTDRLDLLEALKRVSVVSTDRTLGVKFQIKEGSLEILTNNPSVGQGDERVDIAYEGEDLVIGFNALYFIEALSVLNTEEVSTLSASMK